VITPPVEDRRLTRLTAICAALPETTREYNGQHATFRVRKKTYAYFLDDHHGDGVVALACKSAWAENDVLVAADPDRFYKPAYIGPRGWVGLRLDTGSVDWADVADLVIDSYLVTAPKRLAAIVAGAGSDVAG
jgi:hypothetical protein